MSGTFLGYMQAHACTLHNKVPHNKVALPNKDTSPACVHTAACARNKVAQLPTPHMLPLYQPLHVCHAAGGIGALFKSYFVPAEPANITHVGTHHHFHDVDKIPSKALEHPGEAQGTVSCCPGCFLS